MNETPLTPMSWRQSLGIIATLALVVAVMFHESFRDGMVLFSSDGPLGILNARSMVLPEGFKGMWFDSNWLGGSQGAAAPGFTFILYWLMGPLATAKFLAPLSVLALGLSAAFCFRVFGFRPMVCLLGGLAAELNSNFFSNACWGVATRCSALAATFLALAAIWSSRRGTPTVRVLKLILGGLATGLAVIEGADNGAIFSLFIAAFAFCVSVLGEGSPVRRITRGAAMVAVVAAFAGFMAFQTVQSLVSTQITGIVGMEQTAESKDAQWHKATQWSLPKLEMFRVIIPGIFGYRTDTPAGGQYWGRVGEWGPDPRELPRHSGAGEYAGLLVVLVGAWGVARSFSRKAQTYSATERKLIWFWFGAAFLSALFAWGRHGAFYQLLYALPYFSTIRNPMKFMHPCHMALMILFAYGLQGLAREYFEKARATVTPDAWEKRWKFGLLAVVALCAVGWIMYSAQKADVVKYMTAHFIPAELAPDTVKFSIKEAGIFVLLLALCAGAVLAIQAGIFRGPRAVWAGILLGVILCGDFARANAPWIQYFDFKGRYATNPVIDMLKEKSWEQRVILFNPNFIVSDPALRSFFEQSRERQQLFGYFAQVFASVYHSEWVQHQFQYYNVQMMDVAQEPRMPTEKKMYLEKVGSFLTRYWQLTNTRYLFAPGGGFVDVLNDRFDPQQRRFRVKTAFNLFQKPGTTHIGIEATPGGAVALIEFTGALPRAQLFTQWRSVTNDVAALNTLGDAAFNPVTEVLVAEDIPAPAAGAAPATGQVEFTQYKTKHFTQRTSSTAPGVLLVNDRHHPDWKITIDGQPAKLLRANFIMRAVQVPAGQHTIEWRFEPKTGTLYVTLSALAFGALLCGLLAFLTRAPAAATRRK